jgi:3-deoxy-7-phosphoheptulonate synthase
LILKRFFVSSFVARKRRSLSKNHRSSLNGASKKKVLILGPCSIHSFEGALSYARNVFLLQEKVKDHLFLVMRCFIEKPRTKNSWKGFMNDPDLDGSCDIRKGIFLSRKLLIALAKMAVPAALEFLDLHCSCFFEDLVTWGFIGARTSLSQPHRQMASSFSMPVGFKNPIDGNLEHGLHSVEVASLPHRCLRIDKAGKLCIALSRGNPHAHLVLRGALTGPNYHLFPKIKEALEKRILPKKIMIDCAHDNANSCLDKQKEVFRCAAGLMQNDDALFGLMLESNLIRGSQKMDVSKIEGAFYGKALEGLSITDPCLDWEETEELVFSLYEELSQSFCGLSRSSGLMSTFSS